VSEKEDVLRLIEALPDNVSLEEIMRELYVHLQFQRGVQEWNEQRKNKKAKPNMNPRLH
jgi:hypothetical protein